ncbi:MAG: flagellar motor protein MotB [Bdellovibrionota bacterium]
MVDSKNRTPVFSMQNKNWLVTFGDLLTLLLTFFVMSIAIGGQNETATAENIQKNQISTKENSQLEEIEVIPRLVKLSGTNIAIQTLRTPLKEVGLDESDFNTESDHLTAKAAQRLRAILSARKDEFSTVRLELCGGLGGYATEVSWYKSISRALFVQSQLVDAGISKSQLAIRPLGPHCELLKDDAEKQLVGRIKL